MLKVGVIGLGYWGPNLVRVFSASKRSTVTAVADTRSDRRARVKDQYPHILVLDSADDLIGEDIDAVVIATPLRDHYTLASKALAAGKHILVEKPFVATSAQAATINRMAREAGRVVMVDHTFVYNPAVNFLERLIGRKELGDLLYFDSRRINLGLFQPDSDVVWDLAVHDLAILDCLVGTTPSVITAVGAAHLDGHPHNTAFITLQYPSQFVAHIDVNWLSPVKVRQMLIGGSKRMVIYDDLALENRLRVYDCGADGLNSEDASYRKRVDYRVGDMWAPHIPNVEPLAELASHFIDCIYGLAEPRSGGDAGLRIVKLLEGATESLRLGGVPVQISDIA
jgi:predicted dehydrogenase